jgi:hypothetical protein
LDELTVELRVPETVASGDELPTTMVVESPSDHGITDPACELASYRYGLVPEGEPDSDLWQAVVVACDGPFTMAPGYKAEFDGPTFIAATRYGVPSTRVSTSRPSSGLPGRFSGLPIQSQ